MTALARPTSRWRATYERVAASRWAVLIPMAVAALLGITTIGSKSMWLDEAYSAALVRLPWLDGLAFMFHHEMQASPYYMALQAWSALGDSETALRSLSVVVGVVGVAATYALGRRFGVGLPAALLLAVSPFFIHYEQEVRVYTLLVAWSAITTLVYLRLVDRPNRWRALAYVVAAIGLIYIHPLSAWMLVAHAVATFFFVARQWRWRLEALYIPVLIAAVPMVRFLVNNRTRADWISPITPYGFVHALSQLMGATSVSIAFAVVIGLGLLRGWRREIPVLRLPILVVVFTIGGILLLSIVVQPLFVDRYLIGILPFVFIIAARAVQQLPWPRVILAGLVVLSLVSVASWYVNGYKDDWRAAAAYVDAQAQPTDGVIFWPDYTRIPFTYYTTVGEPLYPSTPWSANYMPFLGLNIDLPPNAENPRIWLVRSTVFHPPAEISAFLQNYTTVSTQLFGGSQPEIQLLVRR